MRRRITLFVYDTLAVRAADSVMSCQEGFEAGCVEDGCQNDRNDAMTTPRSGSLPPGQFPGPRQRATSYFPRRVPQAISCSSLGLKVSSNLV